MKTYPLTIISPEGKLLDEPVESLVAPGRNGLFGVLADHAPLVAILGCGVLTVKREGGARFFSLGSGVLEVREDGDVLVLADQAKSHTDEAAAVQAARTCVNEDILSITPNSTKISGHDHDETQP